MQALFSLKIFLYWLLDEETLSVRATELEETSAMLQPSQPGSHKMSPFNPIS